MTNEEMNTYDEPEIMGLRQVALDSKLMENAARALGLQVHRQTIDVIKFNAPGDLSNQTTVWWTRERPFDADAHRAATQKGLTKGILSAAGVKVPEGLSLSLDDRQGIRDAFDTFDGPVVVKPNQGTGGLGVHVNIRTHEELARAVRKIRTGPRVSEKNDGYIVMERYLKGTEIRAFVVGDEVVSIWRKRQPYVVGDGVHTIEELTEPWNENREKNPRLWKSRVLISDDYLATFGKTRQDVPAEGEEVPVQAFGAVARGSATWDITDSVSATVKAEAVKAVQAVPNLGVAGVDLIVRPGFGREANSVLGVLELNSAPSIANAHFPVFGTPRDVATAIVEFYAKKNGIEY